MSAHPAKPRTQIKRITNKYKSELSKSSSALKKSAEPPKKASAPPSAKRPAAAVGPRLDVNAKEYDGIYKTTRQAVGKKPIHAEDQNRIDHILRVFDLNPDFGPCAGMTRLERWTRAEDMGLEPPPEIKDILLTQEGKTEDRYLQSVLYSQEL